MSNPIDKVISYFEDTQRAQNILTQAERNLSGGPSKYYFKKIEGYCKSLFELYAPFKVGDEVRLNQTVKSCGSGWDSSLHFLVEGALGVVREVDHNGTMFTASVEFYTESWKNLETGKVTLTEENNRHVFGFTEIKLDNVTRGTKETLESLSRRIKHLENPDGHE